MFLRLRMLCKSSLSHDFTSLINFRLGVMPKRHNSVRTLSATSSPENSSTPLVRFSNARLAYPKEDANENSNDSSNFILKDLDITLPDWKDDGDDQSNRKGGIAIIGRNGSGKTLLGKAIIAAGSSSGSTSNPYLSSGSLEMPLKEQQKNAASALARKDRHLLGRAGRSTPSPSRSTTVAHVSFDSHRKLLEDRDKKSGDSVTAFKAIASVGNAPGRLNPAARFLVIRFGLYPLMHRTVDTLSTGEIRKVLLARALSMKPSLLILDHAFDGLDIPSRKILQELVSKTIKGFTNDLLVQGVSSKDTADKTQVVLMSHRAEELDEIKELDIVAWWGGDKNTWNVLRRSCLVPDDETATWSLGQDVLCQAMGIDLPPNNSIGSAIDIDWEAHSLPSKETVRKWWNFGLGKTSTRESESEQEILVEAKDLTVQKGDATLLKNLTWTVRKGERWIVGGGNGAGKSTLSRLLALGPETAEDSSVTKRLRIFPYRESSDPRTNVGWVSTESHMKQQQQKTKQNSANNISTRDFVQNHSPNEPWEDVIFPVLDWLGILDDSSKLDRPFHTLSQGEQKMVLIAIALIQRPPLLILDEPCQGLDLLNRTRLLQVVETICRSTDIALVYITHHLDEELVPSVSHALHLKDRREVYKGPIENYSVEEYYDDEEIP